MARPQKHSEDLLLARAMELFWRRGYEATSIRDLEAALDLRSPAIYRRFTNKDTLFLRVVDRYIETVVAARIDAYLGVSDDPVVDLYRFFRTAQSERGCILTNTAVESTARPVAVRRRVRAGLERMRRAILRELRRAHALGYLARDPTVVSHELIVAMQGLMVLGRLGQDRVAARRLTQAVFSAAFPEHPSLGAG